MGGESDRKHTHGGFKVEYDRSGRARCKQYKEMICRFYDGQTRYSFSYKSKRTTYHLIHQRYIFF